MLFACSGTDIDGSWTNPEFKGKVQRIYLVGIARDEMNRRVFEDSFSNHLFGMGVSTESSYRDIMTSDEVNKDTLAQKMTEKHCDAVLLTKLIGQRKETVTTYGGHSGYVPGPYYGGRGRYARPHYYNSWGSYYGRRHDVFYTPPMKNEYVILTVESVMYDLQTEELIWSAQLETTVEGSIDNMMKDYVEQVSKDLKGKGLI
jgi:hypothetical protein